MIEVMLVVSGYSYYNYVYPSDVSVEYAGHGSKQTTLSGLPKEIVRAKRLQSITLKFDKVSRSEYEYVLDLWQNSYQLLLYCEMPELTSLLNGKYVTIPLDGMKLEHIGGDEFGGSVVFSVLS